MRNKLGELLSVSQPDPSIEPKVGDFAIVVNDEGAPYQIVKIDEDFIYLDDINMGGSVKTTPENFKENWSSYEPEREEGGELDYWILNDMLPVPVKTAAMVLKEAAQDYRDRYREIWEILVVSKYPSEGDHPTRMISKQEMRDDLEDRLNSGEVHDEEWSLMEAIDVSVELGSVMESDIDPKSGAHLTSHKLSKDSYEKVKHLIVDKKPYQEWETEEPEPELEALPTEPQMPAAGFVKQREKEHAQAMRDWMHSKEDINLPEFISKYQRHYPNVKAIKDTDMRNEMGLVLAAQESGDRPEYKAFVNKKLKERGVSGLGDLSADEKKKFFKQVDREWKAKDEKAAVRKLAVMGLKKSANLHSITMRIVRDDEEIDVEAEVLIDEYGKGVEESRVLNTGEDIELTNDEQFQAIDIALEMVERQREEGPYGIEAKKKLVIMGIDKNYK